MSENNDNNNDNNNNNNSYSLRTQGNVDDICPVDLQRLPSCKIQYSKNLPYLRLVEVSMVHLVLPMRRKGKSP